MRAFTFIDHVHEVTPYFRPGADPADVLADLSASTSHAALWGRTNYGRAFTKFEESFADALGPKTTLLILGGFVVVVAVVILVFFAIGYVFGLLFL